MLVIFPSLLTLYLRPVGAPWHRVVADVEHGGRLARHHLDEVLGHAGLQARAELVASDVVGAIAETRSEQPASISLGEKL